MNFLRKLFSLFTKKKSTERLLQDNALAIIAKLNDLDRNPGLTDAHNKVAIKNIIMMMRSVSDRYNTYQPEDINEISRIINTLISDIEEVALGVSSVSSLEVKAVTKSINNYIALLAFYINNNIRSGKKHTTEENMNDRRTAAKNEYNNEVLGIKIKEEEAKLNEQKNKLGELKGISAKIIEKISKMRESDPEISLLVKERKTIQDRIAACEKIIEAIVISIQKIGKQIVQNEYYAALLEETATLRDVLTYRSYGSIEELDRAIEKYNEVSIEVETEQDVADEMFDRVRTSNSNEEEYDEELKEAMRKAKENEKKAKTKAEDSANFDFNTETEVNND